MFELDLVDLDGYICAAEVLESARVVEVQVPDYYGFDVGDGVAGSGDRGGEFVFFRVVYAREDIVQGRAPDRGVVFSPAGFEEDEAFCWVGDEDGDDGCFAAGGGGVGVAEGAGCALGGGLGVFG